MTNKKALQVPKPCIVKGREQFLNRFQRTFRYILDPLVQVVPKTRKTLHKMVPKIVAAKIPS